MLSGLALVSIVTITLELTTRYLDPVRSAISAVVAPVLLVADLPYMAADTVDEALASRDALAVENQNLKRQLLRLSQLTQQYPALKAENQRLRQLLDSRARLSVEVLITEVLGVVPTNNTHQVIIDRGEGAELAVGQAVIDANGLFGQIVEVGPLTSRVLMVADREHAVPVEVVRNGVRSIAAGNGSLDSLELEHVPVTADIREGDLLVSSGLGGQFPKGYPVGRVAAVIVEPTAAFAEVTVAPMAALDRAQELLVLFEQTQGVAGADGTEADMDGRDADEDAATAPDPSGAAPDSGGRS